MKDNEIGEIKGNFSLKKINSRVDILDRFDLTRFGKIGGKILDSGYNWAATLRRLLDGVLV